VWVGLGDVCCCSGAVFGLHSKRVNEGWAIVKKRERRVISSNPWFLYYHNVSGIFC
jgi:hypothetical protein